MKKILFLILLLTSAFAFTFAEGIAEKAAEGNAKAEMSYAFGMILASDFVPYGMEFNYNSFIQGFKEVMEGDQTRYNMDEAMDLAQAAFQEAVLKQENINMLQEEVFFQINGQRDGVITTESGLQYEIVIEGTGRQPVPSDYVRVNYQGALLNGSIFDSSYQRGEPEDFPLQGVIPGFSEGILLMKEGGMSRLFIPSEMAYGSRSIGIIPPYATLVFEVELLEILENQQNYFDYGFDMSDFDDFDWWPSPQ